jgi:S1-C subfamily serine protease
MSKHRQSTGVRLALAILVVCGGGVRTARADATAPASSCPASLPDLYDRIVPAVVSIGAASVNPYDVSEQISRVMGSGLIIDSSGLVLTNSHLVFGRQAITVTLTDGTVLPAKLVGADPVLDIAVVRIPPPANGTPSIPIFGDSDRVRVGEEVLAIGNPLGLTNTLTRGIVSAVNRTLPAAAFSLTEPLIQTDAPINPGNSGGPLIDRCGQVLGITTALLPGAQNIGFAIPINLAKVILQQLVTDGRVIRPWLGVQGQFVSQPLKELLRIPLVDGFLVEVVEPGSPAERTGLRGGELDLTIGGQPLLVGGDIITGISGTRIGSPAEIVQALRNLAVGATLQLTIARGSETLIVECVLSERPVVPGDSAASPAGTSVGSSRHLGTIVDSDRRPRAAF